MNQQETRSLLKTLNDRVSLVLLKNGEDGLFAELKAFAHKVSGLSDLIMVEETSTTNAHIAPAINLVHSSRSNISYAALPEGGELAPFLRTLAHLGNGTNSLNEDTVHHLRSLKHEVTIEVLITQSCPVCPRMAEMVNQFALCSQKIKVWIVDVGHFPHIREKHRASSAPTTVINDRVQIVGAVNEKELLNWIYKALSEEGLPDVLASLLTIGNSGKALEIITEEDRPDLLSDLMGRPEFTVRLGAMVVIESLQQTAPGRIPRLVPGLIKLLDSDMVNIRGDAAFMLGKIGDPRAIEPLRRLVPEEQNPDILEIAREALDSLQGQEDV
ncbi:MAG: thioredoxin family protein [Thermodesulfobacteriota bacterium]